MSDVDPRLVAAMREQLSRRPAGAERVGWKYGSGEEEHIGGDHVVGHITSATEVVIDNDYHRAVVFGPFADELRDGIRGTLVVNGERRAAGPVSDELAERVAAVDRVLRSVSEELRPGDGVITGYVVNTAVHSGDEVVAELGALGRVGLRIA